jgi:DNA-binding winged helix-turn-helix (wHTH) protein
MNGSAAGQNDRSKVRFGVFTFDPHSHELTKHGTRLKVQEQPLQILAALLERAGEIVSREELQRRLWPDGTFVDFEQSLNKAVNKLREALGDSSDHPLYIETLARRGYRFLAPVERDAAPPAIQSALARKGTWRWLPAGAAVLAIILGTGLWPIEVPQVERVVQLTSDFTNKGLPVPDGGRLLYCDSGKLWSVSASGGEPKRVSLPFLSPSAYGLVIFPSAGAQRNILLGSYLNEAPAAEW